MSKGAIIGLVLGVLAAIIVGIGGIWWMMSGDEYVEYEDYYYEEEAPGAEDGYEDYYYEEEVEEERYYDVYGREHNHISTCYTCGISYTIQTLPYLGKYCSQTCCGAYERDLRDCGY